MASLRTHIRGGRARGRDDDLSVGALANDGIDCCGSVRPCRMRAARRAGFTGPPSAVRTASSLAASAASTNVKLEFPTPAYTSTLFTSSSIAMLSPTTFVLPRKTLGARNSLTASERSSTMSRPGDAVSKASPVNSRRLPSAVRGSSSPLRPDARPRLHRWEVGGLERAYMGHTNLLRQRRLAARRVYGARFGRRSALRGSRKPLVRLRHSHCGYQQISFGKGVLLDSGYYPSVAANGNGVAIALHAGSSYYGYSTLVLSNRTSKRERDELEQQRARTKHGVVGSRRHVEPARPNRRDLHLQRALSLQRLLSLHADGNAEFGKDLDIVVRNVESSLIDANIASFSTALDGDAAITILGSSTAAGNNTRHRS